MRQHKSGWRVLADILAFLAAALAFWMAAAKAWDTIQQKLLRHSMNEAKKETPQSQPEEEEAEQEKPEEEENRDVRFLDADLKEISPVEKDEHVVLTIRTDSRQAGILQNDLALIGYSSTYDPDSGLLDVQVSGPRDAKELKQLQTVLNGALSSHSATYAGFVL